MASKQQTIDYILDQASARIPVTARKMFGEYALYADGKLVALVCDDDLFIKPNEAARAFLGSVVERPPYPSAKPSFLIAADRLDDRDWVSELFRISAIALPSPKAKRPRKPAS